MSGNRKKLAEGEDATKTQTQVMHLKCPSCLWQFPARTWCKRFFFINSELTLGMKFIFIISLMHSLSDKIRSVQRKFEPEKVFTFKT